MQTSLETLGQLERRLNVALPIADIETEVQQRLQRLARTVKLPGFRPGKVPMKMVVQQYGPQVRSDVLGDKVQESFNQAVREQNLRVAGYPRIEPKTAAEDSTTFEYAAVFEVYPDVVIGDLAEVEIKKPAADVGDADVDRTLEILRKQRTAFEKVERAAAKGDRVLVDFNGKIDGVEFAGGQAVDFPMVVGTGRMLPEFEAAVEGMSAGETKEFSLTFPADYHGADVAGKTATFTVTVKQVDQPVLPEVNSDFAKAFGVASGDIAQLRTEIGDNLRLELKRRVEANLRGQAFDALKKVAALELPNALVAMEVQRMMQGMAEDLKQRGMDSSISNLRPEMFEEQARERVRLGLIVAEVVRANDLQAKPEQIRAIVEENAQSYEQPEQVISWFYQKPERLADFEAQAIEGNVVAWVMSRAKVEEQATTFADLVGQTA